MLHDNRNNTNSNNDEGDNKNNNNDYGNHPIALVWGNQNIHGLTPRQSANEKPMD